jgi:Family of unknown function (DUF6922)
MIPQHLRHFFWEISPDTLDPHEYGDYVIGRILELGTEEAVSWMKATFREEEIKKVIREDHRLSPKSATYWALMYDIPSEQVSVLSRQPVSR